MRRKQKTQPGGWVLDKFSISLGHLGHIVGLRTLLALHDLELYLIALLKTLIAFRLYRAVVDEYIGSTFLTDKSKTLCVVKPLNRAFDSRHLHTFLISFWGRTARAETRTSRPPLGTAQGDLLSHARSGIGERRGVILGVLVRLLVDYNYAANYSMLSKELIGRRCHFELRIWDRVSL
jgi:hypothetical protein